MKNTLIMVGVVGGLLSLPIPAHSQTGIVNPSGVAFTCPDHALDDNHEIDIIRVSDGVVVQTLLVGDPAEVNGEVVVAINVMPIAFGQYRFAGRAISGSIKSATSDPSDIWTRAPRRPGKPEPRQ